MPKISLNASKKTKNTPAGEIPVDWAWAELGKVAKVITGSTPSGDEKINYGGSIPFVTPGDVKPSTFIRQTERTLTSEGLRKTRPIPAGSTVVVCIGSSIGKAGIVPEDCGANQQINAATAGGQVVPEFLFYSVSSATPHLTALTGNQAVPIVNKSEFSRIPIPVPPLPEQEKIAEILTTWDEALEKLDALIDAKERRKKGLMQRVLTGKHRIKSSKGLVEFRRASEIFVNCSERNGKSFPILSVTQDQGVVLRSSLERRIAHNEGTNGSYKVVRNGDFVISLRSFQGGLEYSEIDGAVSPAYHVISPIAPISSRFYRHYFKSQDFIGRLAIAVIGIRDGKQISFTDFGFIRIPYPHPEDQERIATLLDACDAELTLLRGQRDALDLQKRGLMQRLLTGRIRITV